jgi:hypothetical protein
MLHARVKGKSLTLAELKQSLKGRGSAMLLVLLGLPFCFVAIPGLSTPFGIAICLIGACLAIGMMERDGLCVLVGHLTAIVAWVYIGLTSVLSVGGFQRLLDFFQL